MIRKAGVKDVPAIKELVDYWAEKDALLSRELGELYKSIQSFKVFEKNGKVAGCGCLAIVWDDLSEIRSLAVKEELVNNGIGSKLVKALEEDASQLGVGKVFTLTTVPGFFQKIGYSLEDKAKMPTKIWADCVNCTKFPNCDEEVLVKDLNYPSTLILTNEKNILGQ